MFKSFGSYVMIALLMFSVFNGCKDTSLSPTPSPTAQINDEIIRADAPVYVSEGFETGSKTSYAAANVTLSSGVWNLNDALIGTSASDIKNGTASARARNSGKLTQQFNRTTGAGTVTIQHAKYGSDAATTWSLWYSTNSGSSWVQNGSSVSTSATTLQTASFTVNIAGTIRF
ncbi:MAG: hypothetical protein HYV28_14515 [Ignavibacteriales bacterium]|nr:hypothetical protein [Ignavibacteriales bacterium]